MLAGSSIKKQMSQAHGFGVANIHIVYNRTLKNIARFVCKTVHDRRSTLVTSLSISARIRPLLIPDRYSQIRCPCFRITDLFDVLHGTLWVTIADIFGDRGAEEDRFLRDHADLLPEPGDVQIANTAAVQQNLTEQNRTQSEHDQIANTPTTDDLVEPEQNAIRTRSDTVHCSRPAEPDKAEHNLNMVRLSRLRPAWTLQNITDQNTEHVDLVNIGTFRKNAEKIFVTM